MIKLTRKINKVTVVICVIVAIAFTLGLGLHNRIHALPKNSVQITGATVDNGYNNYISGSDPVNLSGDLVRIGGKLYYNYYGSYASYGLYEIGDHGSQRIHWDGYGPWAFLTGYSYKLYPIREHSGKLLMNTNVDGSYYVYNRDRKEWELAQGSILSYDKDSQNFTEVRPFDSSGEPSALTYQETFFGFVYESLEKNDLWVYSEEDGPVEISAENVVSFYAVGNRIYYLTKAAANGPYILRVFDWARKVDVMVCQLENYKNIPYFIVEDNLLIFAAQCPNQNTQSVYTLDLTASGQKETAIYTINSGTSDGAYIFSWNVWDKSVYLCTTEGLVALDLVSGMHCVLCDKVALACDIVDDAWVYFTEKDSHYLWRVGQSGGNVELVLGNK